MHPAPSVIALTTLSGAGYGLLFLLAMTAPAGLLPSSRWFAMIAGGLALGLITSGLIASLLHLGHPGRAWRAVSQWRSSWLSREGLAALLTYPPALVFGAGWVITETATGWLTAVALLAATGAVLTVYCTSMIYASLAPIRQWHQPLVPPIYLTFALMTGALLLHFLLLLWGVPGVRVAGLALAATLLTFLLKALYWRTIDRAPAVATPETATGLGPLGQVRALDPPHTQTNYLLSEMGFRIARKHALKLRRLVYLLGLGGVATTTILTLPTTDLAAATLGLLAVVCGGIAVVVERWLFFAEATHTVTLYYGGNTS